MGRRIAGWKNNGSANTDGERERWRRWRETVVGRSQTPGAGLAAGGLAGASVSRKS